MEPMEQMKELIKEMQAGQARSMETMMKTMFDRMKESNLAGPEGRKGHEPGQIDDRKNIRGPEPFDGMKRNTRSGKQR
jgi:hypothetical protein